MDTFISLLMIVNGQGWLCDTAPLLPHCWVAK